MSYAGVESDEEYAMRTYGLRDREPKHCGHRDEHAIHNYDDWFSRKKFVCTGNLGPEKVAGGHRNDHDDNK